MAIEARLNLTQTSERWIAELTQDSAVRARVQDARALGIGQKQTALSIWSNAAHDR